MNCWRRPLGAFRSGSRLIAAAEASLGSPRNYQADPARTDEGEIHFDEINGGLGVQARWAVQTLVPQLISAGTEPHEIAILYKGKGDLLDALAAETVRVPDAFTFERDARFPSTLYTRWLQRCASKALGGLEAASLGDLAGTYRVLLDQNGRDNDELTARCRMLDAVADASPGIPLHEWMASVDRTLDLRALLIGEGSSPDEVEALDRLLAPPPEPVALVDFAHGVQVEGRVIVTTYHASKGRQFDAIILPGLQTSLFPHARWQGGEYRTTRSGLAEDRRLFYVGLTRARHRVHLVYSPSFRNRFGYNVHGRSSFIDEVAARVVLLE